MSDFRERSCRASLSFIRVNYRRIAIDWFNLVALAFARVVLLVAFAPAVVLADQSSGSASSFAVSPQASTASISGAVVSPSNWLPPSLAIGSFEAGPLTLRPTLNIQFDGFREVNNGWGGGTVASYSGEQAVLRTSERRGTQFHSEIG